MAQVINDLSLGGQPEGPNQGRIAQPYPRRPEQDVHLGQQIRPGMNRLGKKMAELETLSDDPSGSYPVKRTSWGYEEEPPEKSPSRWKQVGLGLLQGALAGASQTGTLSGALGGAAVGGVSGGVSPRLMMAFTRAQDIRRAQGELSNEYDLARQQAQVGGLEAEAEYRRQQPDIEREKIQRQLDHDEAVMQQRRLEERDRNERAEADRRNRIETATIRSRGTGAGGTQGAIAAEGAEEDRQAGAETQGVQEAIDKWTQDNARDDAWMRGVEKEWNQEAAKQYAEALKQWNEQLFDKGPKPKLSDFQAEIRASSDKAADYEQTKANRTQRAKDIEEQKKKLEGLHKEQRGGKAKAARSGTAGTKSTYKPPAPPGVTETSVRADARRKGQDEEKAVAKAREFGWIP